MISSRIKGSFKGWSGHSQFELANGQVWEQARYEYYYHYAYSPVVTIRADGKTGVLEVEGVSRTLQVRQIK